MSGIFDKVRQISTLGLNVSELYKRAFERGVLLKDFAKATDLFHEAARKFSEKGNVLMATQALANALLYRYLETGHTNNISPLIQALRGLQQIERIGLPTEMMPTGPLYAELDCRAVEAAIAQVQDDIVRLRDLHKLTSTKFQAIMHNP